VAIGWLITRCNRPRGDQAGVAPGACTEPANCHIREMSPLPALRVPKVEQESAQQRASVGIFGQVQVEPERPYFAGRRACRERAKAVMKAGRANDERPGVVAVCRAGRLRRPCTCSRRRQAGMHASRAHEHSRSAAGVREGLPHSCRARPLQRAGRLRSGQECGPRCRRGRHHARPTRDARSAVSPGPVSGRRVSESGRVGHVLRERAGVRCLRHYGGECLSGCGRPAVGRRSLADAVGPVRAAPGIRPVGREPRSERRKRPPGPWLSTAFVWSAILLPSW